MKRNVLNSPRLLELKKKRRKVFFYKILLLFFAFLVIFVSLAFLSHVSALNISEIEVVGNKVVDTEIIKAVVEKELTGNYLWFFPKKDILIYPKNNIKKELNNQLKRINNINLTIKNNKILEIDISERVGLYIWCGITPPQIGTEDRECYFLDKYGYIFDKAPHFSGDIYFKFYGKVYTNTGIPLSADDPAGSYFLKENFEKIILFKQMLEGIELKPVTLYAEDNENLKFSLSGGNSLSPKPEIIFKSNSDFEILAENIKTALSTEPLQSDFKNKYSSLQYVDLRFGNKVYYKFK